MLWFISQAAYNKKWETFAKQAAASNGTAQLEVRRN